LATITGVAVLWFLAAALLWRTSVPDLGLPKLDPHQFFSTPLLARAARYERFVRIDVVLSLLATMVALLVFVRRSPRLARNTGLGPIGAGVIVGMILLILLWAVNLPFAIALRWWDRRHHLAQGSWIDWLLEPWAQLAGGVAGAILLIVVVMAFARRYPRSWWLPVTPIFVAIAAVSLFVQPYLLAGGINSPRSPQLRQDVRTLEQAEGIDVPVDVEKVSNLTTEANAFAVGLGPTERIVIWNTLLDGRFTHGEVRVVLAHEIGHIAHRHLWKGLGWTVLFAFPIAFALARITRRRGGLGDPGVLPYGFLVLVLLNAVLTPVTNAISRRYEAEADWSALRAARDPDSQVSLFEKFAKTSLQQPDPPFWAYVYFEDHPTLMQRIAMAEAWKKRESP
jgi:STE24 endopeptidase